MAKASIRRLSKNLNKRKIKLKIFKKGFTLTEIIVVIGILALIISIVLVLIDPVAQIKKSRNTQRYMGIRQLADMSELYFNENGKYPANYNTLVTDQYLKKVPQDPDSNYIYELGPGSNPSWAVIYGTIYKKWARAAACDLPLDTDPTCKPINYDRTDDFIWSCKILGQIDCNQIKTFTLPLGSASTPTPSPIPTASPTPTSTPTPTPTATPVPPTPTLSVPANLANTAYGLADMLRYMQSAAVINAGLNGGGCTTSPNNARYYGVTITSTDYKGYIQCLVGASYVVVDYPGQYQTVLPQVYMFNTGSYYFVLGGNSSQPLDYVISLRSTYSGQYLYITVKTDGTIIGPYQ
ncbi:MAG: prepilin-type N-terminal cleavage/methylation domain-containing protein [Patescibacteria group bacterium]|nr:prepilin-type N-terminal cleavage/methylation domain-containing protein [Patescibacteria group bacterium]